MSTLPQNPDDLPAENWRQRFVYGFFSGVGVCFLGSLYAEGVSFLEAGVISFVCGLVVGGIGAFCNKLGFDFLLRIINFPN